ncbi:MAG: hypothetical protein ABEJ02_04920 [Candidatus Paceibacteria bacterium]
MDSNEVVFLDSSVIISAILSQTGGSFYIITQLHSSYDFIINKYVLDEVENVISQKFSGDKEKYNMLFLLLSLSSIEVKENPKKDEVNELTDVISSKDVPILFTSLQYADYLLTLDKEFLQDEVKKFCNSKGLNISNPKYFIENNSSI